LNPGRIKRVTDHRVYWTKDGCRADVCLVDGEDETGNCIEINSLLRHATGLQKRR